MNNINNFDNNNVIHANSLKNKKKLFVIDKRYNFFNLTYI